MTWCWIKTGINCTSAIPKRGGATQFCKTYTHTISMQIYSVAQRIHGHFSESYFQNYRYHKSDIKHMFIRFTLHEFPYLSSWVVSVNHISRSSEARTLWRFSSQPFWGANGSLPNSRLPTDNILSMECRTTQQNEGGVVTVSPNLHRHYFSADLQCNTVNTWSFLRKLFSKL